ncbi:MAG: phosphoenolpyruvate carboxylase [Candidatus Magasanikbacteria bacterium RIFCSPLOWO2_12_FULL_47_9b]|nr:MAG: phosphoenolpyruvate carboxylase [Candidatus Magasanikbacteria bacterium RIFCSPLOWO2_02_FULL_47_16]OGH80174.1 MAG: phosphoenolpyruvate carboxylase [Candidatus Magasanikbacteria bacterium RIFCSPHIGHO2_02_FULL_48_18]OGH82856.1 MAG: phosphoenolpyruvate carboxylase [Candidatus Magasanikbacteria bacterium RIFCSPLOWO2_12_FULL_47_9b]
MHRIPRTMSTQHPDNVHQPFFVEQSLIGGEDEIQEAYYAYSHLGCDEQMWDFEGKEVDNFVVKKLLTKNESFFQEKKLGRDVFLTLRVPNPEVEKTEAKILLETLESIPRSYDAARLFYGDDIAPIFQVIVPMTTSASGIDRIYHYYKDIVAGKNSWPVRPGDMSIGEWIGDFQPQEIQMIPLVEDMNSMLGVADILREYLRDKPDVLFQRVFLARSDPAVNYGNVGAVLINKIALQRIDRLAQEMAIPMYPILGAGSAPFRGNLRPQTVSSLLRGYPSVQTFTIQSSFKFDHRPDVVQNAIHAIDTHPVGPPLPIDEAYAEDVLRRYVRAYTAQIRSLAPLINAIAPAIPRRRKRKLHIGLFGYSRSMDDLRLPRAITFTASLYSLGLPPELLGLNALTKKDIVFLRSVYPSFDSDLKDALTFYNPDMPHIPEDVGQCVRAYIKSGTVNSAHKEITEQTLEALKRESFDDVVACVLRSASVRNFLG